MSGRCGCLKVQIAVLSQFLFLREEAPCLGHRAPPDLLRCEIYALNCDESVATKSSTAALAAAKKRESNCLKNLVGAGRFERPTPCAQGSKVRCDGDLSSATKSDKTSMDTGVARELRNGDRVC